jgi:hypothetical protein
MERNEIFEKKKVIRVITGLVIRKKKRKNNLLEDLIYDTTTFPTRVG